MRSGSSDSVPYRHTMNSPDPFDETLQILACVDRYHIAYLNSILESYEGLAMMRTLDPGKGIICIYVSNPLSEETRSLLLSLQEEIGFEFINSPPSLSLSF